MNRSAKHFGYKTSYRKHIYA